MAKGSFATAERSVKWALAHRAHCPRVLHELVAAEHQAMDISQQSAAARALYEMPAAFDAIHRQLIADVVAPALQLGPLYLQGASTFRVFFSHAAGYPGATSYHNDIMLGQNPREVNVFVPLVRCEGGRSLLLAELSPSLATLRRYDSDFARFGRDTQGSAALQQELEGICRPLQVGVGDIVVSDSRCLHAAPPNATPLTRVTFDTRVLPVAALAGQQNRYQCRGRRRASFAIGDCFTAEPVGG